MAQLKDTLISGLLRVTGNIFGNLVGTVNGKEVAPFDKGIYPVVGTQTAATNAWTGSIDLPSLFDGLTIAYFLPYAGTSTAATLNLTLSDGSTTGAVNVYETASTRVTTHYGAGSTILLTYWSAGSVSISGTAITENRWTRADYGSSAETHYYDRLYRCGFVPSTALGRYVLCFQQDDTHILPANTYNNDTSTTKTLTTESFDPFGSIFIYYSTTVVAAEGDLAQSTLYLRYVVNLSYSFNTGTSITAKKAIYLKCVPQSDGMVKLHSTPIVQELPSTEDGCYYIYLGQGYSNTSVELVDTHPVFIYKNGMVRELSQYSLTSGDAATVNGHIVAADVPSNVTTTTYVDSEIASLKQYVDNNFTSEISVTGTLSAGSSTITLSDSNIESTSTIDIYTNLYGMIPVSITTVTGSVTIQFQPQLTDVNVKIIVRNI